MKQNINQTTLKHPQVTDIRYINIALFKNNNNIEKKRKKNVKKIKVLI